MDKDALTTERADLARKLRKRENSAGFSKNAEAIKARMAVIDAALKDLDAGPVEP